MHRAGVCARMNLPVILVLVGIPVSLVFGLATWWLAGVARLDPSACVIAGAAAAVVVFCAWSFKATRDCRDIAAAANCRDLKTLPARVRAGLRDGDGAGGQYVILRAMWVIKYGVMLYCDGDRVLTTAVVGPHAAWQEAVIMDNMDSLWGVVEGSAEARRGEPAHPVGADDANR